MEVNTYEGKIERKKIMEGYRYLNRMKSIELIGENILWDIYEKCRSDEVLHYLNRYFIKFYFFFAPNLTLQMRKSRIDDVMGRLMEHIRGSYAKGNYRIVKHSLELLRGIFELVKEDERVYYQTETPSPYKAKIDVKYLANSYRFEISENETVFLLKYKVAERLKLKMNTFKLIVRDDQQIE